MSSSPGQWWMIMSFRLTVGDAEELPSTTIVLFLFVTSD